MIGWRARLGAMVPSGNYTVEPEFNQAAPEGVTVHAARLTVNSPVITPESLSRMAEDIEPAVASLKIADVLAYACTSSSFLNGPDWDRGLLERMGRCSGKPVTTTSTSIVAALRVLGASRVAVATPYTRELNDRLAAYLEECDIQVVNIAGLGNTEHGGPNKLPGYSSYRLAREVDRPEAEVLVIGCTAFRSFDILEALERDAGKPVVSANQSTLWMMLRLAGVRDPLPGLGRLMTITEVSGQ